jgi:murein endopeptidase
MTRVARLASLAFALALGFAFVGPAAATEFLPPHPESEFLPAGPGEPPVDFCANWNPEYGYRGYRCCSNGAGRGVATSGRRGRRGRRASSCAPNRIKWNFCDEMTPEQRDYVLAVKAGKVDPLETIQRNLGSRGGQAYCSASNGFLVEGRPLVPTTENRVELRNEARCANFGTDPLVGALEWTGREIKKEFYEPEFHHARMIIGDISAPRGGCISGRMGRRAHKSHTTGVDVDLAFFNPRSGHNPEERFTRNFYVASNWWFLKKIFRNPVACVKIVFVDGKHIRMLERFAKDDPEWSKYRRFIRHIRGHRDHFHIRFGSGPGAPGCAGDPDLEEDEEVSDAPDDGVIVKGEDSADDDDADTDKENLVSAEDLDAAIDAPEQPKRRSNRREIAASAPGAIVSPDSASFAAAGVSSVESGLASGPTLAKTTLPPHKLEPSITAKYAERRVKRRKSRSKRSRRR